MTNSSVTFNFSIITCLQVTPVKSVRLYHLKLEENGFIRRENTIKGKRQVVISVYSTKFGINAYKEMHNSLNSQVLNKSMINYDKMNEVTAELIKMANKLVETYNIKL